MLSCIRKKLPVTAIPAKTMELAQTNSMDITVAVRQDFTGRIVKRLKACLVQVCREVYRILMTYSESTSFIFQREVLVEMGMTTQHFREF